MKFRCEKNLPVVAAAGRNERVRDFKGREELDRIYSITPEEKRQVGLTSFLLSGAENAIPARQLCDLLEYRDTRSLRLAVERERAAGVLILSGMGGYYLPSDDPAEAQREIADFVRRTDARMKSNRLSVRAAKRALRDYERGEISGQTGFFEGADYYGE